MLKQKALPVKFIRRANGTSLLQQNQRRGLAFTRGFNHRLVLWRVFIRLEKDFEKLSLYFGRTLTLNQLVCPSGNLLLKLLLLLYGDEGLLHNFRRGFAKATFASATEIMRRIKQAKQSAQLLAGVGVFGEIVAGQVGEPKFFFGGKLPGHLDFHAAGHLLTGPHELSRRRLVKFHQQLRGFDLDPLAAVELDLRRRLSLRQNPPCLEFPAFFVKCIHGVGFSHGAPINFDHGNSNW